MKTCFLGLRQFYCSEAFLVYCLIAFVLVLANGALAGLSFLYGFAALNPDSAITAALHHSGAAWLVYQIAMGLVAVFATIVDFFSILVILTPFRNSVCLMLLTLVTCCSLTWVPFVITIVLRNDAYAQACDGFDGTVILNGVSSPTAGLSVATFPAEFGGLKWQIFESAPSVYQFGPMAQSSQITLNLTSDTYNTPSISGSFDDDPLSFPGLDLHSNGSWTRSCWAPAVTLKNSSGIAIVETGFTGINDCSQLQVCVRRSSLGLDAIYVAIARILIELQSEVGCCVLSRRSY